MTQSGENGDVRPSKMPEFDMSEKVLHALQASNAHSAKLVDMGYFLVGFLAIITVCVVISFVILLLNMFFF